MAPTDLIPETPPPHNLQAEACALGAVFIKPSCFRYEVAGVLKADDFFLPAHRFVFEVMQALEQRGQPPGDIALVADELNVRGWMKRLEGGEIFLVALAAAVPVAENVDHYVRLVKEKAQLRALLRFGADLRARALAGSTNPLDLIAEATAQLSEIAVGRIEIEEVGAWDPMLDVFEDRQQATVEGRRPKDSGITTGIEKVDQIIVGMTEQNYYLFTGTPGGGKSSALRKAALHRIDDGGACLLCSLEMSRRECLEAMYVTDSRVDTFRAKYGRFDLEDWNRIQATARKMRTAKLVIDETVTDISDAENLIAQWAARLPPEVAAKSMWGLDYVQLAEDRSIDGNDSQVIKSVSRRLKLLTRRIKIPGIVVAQLNREASKEGAKPAPRHLEGSGALEKDPTAIIYFEVEKVDNVATGKAAAHVWKNRSGPTGMVELTWDPRTYDFSSAHQAPSLGPARGRYGSDDDNF
jgi:replicative DNA helicase